MSADINPDATEADQPEVDEIAELVSWQLEKGGGW